MTSLSEACADLAAWLPAATELLAEPDADGAHGGGKPGSAPPWNSAAAAAWSTAHALIRDTEQIFAQAVTGRARPRRGWSDRNTARALEAIEKLGCAMPQEHSQDGKPCRCEYCRAVGGLTACVTQILQLPAIDEAERPRKAPTPCPYCGFSMLSIYARAGKIVCKRGYDGICQDADGNPPIGHVGQSQLDGSPRVTWADGLVT